MKEEMLHALQCLYIAVSKDIARDVNTKVMQYVKELEDKIKEKEERIKLLCEDWTDDEARIEEMLEPIIGKEFIDGNIYCSPGTVGCVEELVRKYRELEKEIQDDNAELDTAWSKVVESIEEPKKGCWHSIVNIRVRENGEREIICNKCNEVVEVIAPLFPDKDANV